MQDPKDIKYLAQVIKLCRKEGVDIIKLGDVEIVLGKVPEAKKSYKTSVKTTTEAFTDPGQIVVQPLDIPTDELTDEQKLFGSSDPSVWPETNTQQ